MTPLRNKDINISRVEKGKHKGLFRLRIKSKYTTTFIIRQHNIDQIKDDLSELGEPEEEPVLSEERLDAKLLGKRAARLTVGDISLEDF